jgi:hypothetical protein
MTARALRLLSALVLLSLGAIASCTSLIGIDDYEGSAPALCGAIAVCYGIENCEARVGGRLEQAPSELRADWLRKFSDFSCTSSCSAARRCLDFEPVCAYAGNCTVPEHCCGFIAGKASCVNDACCGTRGASCTDSSECCEQDCSPITGTCGGVICLESGEPCTDGFECCTGICNDGQCANEVCKPAGLECTSDKECCLDQGLICDPLSGRCGIPQCSPVGAPCGAGCCQGLFCVPTPAPDGILDICSDCDTGRPLGSICSDDAECCSGRCDDEFKLCADASCPIVGQACGPGNDCCEGLCVDGLCACQNEFGAPCQDNDDCCRGRCDQNTGTCACSDDVCGTSEDCCSGSCVANVCALTCAPPECHDECKVGAPLDPAACSVPPNDAACIASVCDPTTGDPYCCCFAWDDLCVGAALADPTCQLSGPCN